MKIKRFEDLNCWKEARKLRKIVSEITRKQYIRRDTIFCNQKNQKNIDHQTMKLYDNKTMRLYDYKTMKLYDYKTKTGG
ncbi:hypothetical protein GQ543_12185 [candidate division WOR-3 bacterium]|nr:hypothetical protein [candidate division WOR-3 bacterium]